MKDIFIVWHYTAYNEKYIEAVFSNEEDAVFFCDERADKTVPGYCNYGEDPAYRYTYEPLFEDREDYEEEKKIYEEEEKRNKKWFEAYNKAYENTKEIEDLKTAIDIFYKDLEKYLADNDPSQV